MNAVAPGFGAHVDHRISDALGLAVKNFILLEDAQRENVHQRISVVAFFENSFAADRRHAETIAIMRDAGDHAFQDSSIARALQRAKADGVHHCDGPRAHGENVAQNAANAGGGALKRLNKAGMVVRFDFEGNGVIAADINDSGIFSRPLQHQLAASGQLAEMNARAFVGAMLAPHHAEDAELSVGGLAAEQRDNFLVFRPGQLMGFDYGWCHSLVCHHQ